MSPELIILQAVVLLFALPLMLRHYLGQLPDAPACPTCRAVTRAADQAGIGVRCLDRISLSVVRECTACGWHGRMRWRWAPEPSESRKNQ